MSVSNEVVQSISVADGSTTEFAIPFDFVPGTIRDVLRVATQDPVTFAVIEKAETTDYEIEAGLSPTKITFLVAPANNLRVLVQRASPKRQTYSYINDGPFPAESHEKALDKLVIFTQELWNRVSRSVRLPDWLTTASFDPTLPQAVTTSAAKVLAINNTGNGLQLGPTITDIATAATAAAAVAAAATSLINWLIGTSFAITESQAATSLLGEAFDGTLISSVIYEGQIIRGTTVFANIKFYFQYRNATWRLVFADEEGDIPHGVTVSFTQSTTVGQIKAAVATDGFGNGTLILKKVTYAA